MKPLNSRIKPMCHGKTLLVEIVFVVKRAVLWTDLLKSFFSKSLGRVILPKNFHVISAMELTFLPVVKNSNFKMVLKEECQLLFQSLWLLFCSFCLISRKITYLPPYLLVLNWSPMITNLPGLVNSHLNYN